MTMAVETGTNSAGDCLGIAKVGYLMEMQYKALWSPDGLDVERGGWVVLE